jgi:hypothetical protein
MRTVRASSTGIVVLIALLVVAGCNENPVGPSLSNVSVGPLSLEPTAGDPAICCCRVRGTARNLNSVPVHATFKFTAFDGVRVQPISKILFFISDFRQGTERSIDAHGFLYPCTIIKDLKTELDVRGITLPPL